MLWTTFWTTYGQNKINNKMKALEHYKKSLNVNQNWLPRRVMYSDKSITHDNINKLRWAEQKIILKSVRKDQNRPYKHLKRLNHSHEQSCHQPCWNTLASVTRVSVSLTEREKLLPLHSAQNRHSTQKLHSITRFLNLAFPATISATGPF